MHAHRIKVLDRTDDDAVVLLVADNLHLELFPADQRFLDQQLMRRRSFQAALADFDELFLVVGDAAAGTAHGEGRADDHREAQPCLYLLRFFHAVCHGRLGRPEANLGHRVLELFAILSLVNRLLAGTDHFDTKLLENSVMCQIQRTVERGLSTHRRQQRIGAFLLDDPFDHLPVDRLDIGHVSHVRIGHDRGGVGVNQNHPEPLFAQRLARLRAGIVELTGLTDDDRASANDQNALYVCTLRHVLLPFGLPGLHHRNETVKQIRHVVRTRARFRVPLERERRHIGTRHALQ